VWCCLLPLVVFILCYMLAAPFFGYLGDRYDRKVILGAGIFFWSAVTLGTSFISESYCWVFFLSRGLVGIGTASYSTVAPTIIADRFDEGKRTTMLSVFYICIPVGSGLGYVLASSMAHVTGDWHWAFRIPERTALLLLDILGSACGPSLVSHSFKQLSFLSSSSWSFVWSSLGLTAMAFVTGALGLWVPMFLYRAQVALGIVQQCLEKSCNSSNSLIFGGITIGTGILGVIAGAEAARRLRKTNNRADPLICATSMFVSSLCLYIAIMVAQKNILSTFVSASLNQQFCNWVFLQLFLLLTLVQRGFPLTPQEYAFLWKNTSKPKLKTSGFASGCVCKKQNVQLKITVESMSRDRNAQRNNHFLFWPLRLLHHPILSTSFSSLLPVRLQCPITAVFGLPVRIR
uniref:Major facilitator superfamily (MFS) profile domain-containing protein n=1 Tax=Pavo cristatus TaxID=9049 RepID=A0A8C9LD70_PAVCR